jgi:hypothetical protein
LKGPDLALFLLISPSFPQAGFIVFRSLFLAANVALRIPDFYFLNFSSPPV